MLKGIILLNGDRYSGKISAENSYVVCCDGAFEWAEQEKIKCDLVLGDFDSLGYKPEGALIYPCEKDCTDGELALAHLITKGVSYIEIYGGSGRREDHFFGNVGLLIKAYNAGVKAVFKSDYTEFYIVDGNTVLNGLKGKTVSLFPIGQSLHIYNSKGLKYGMDNLVISLGESRGLSNIVVSDEASIDIEQGLGILFIVRAIDDCVL